MAVLSLSPNHGHNFCSCKHMYVAPLESYESGLFSASIVSSFGMIYVLKSPPILKDLTWIVYNYGSHRFLSPKISRKCVKESDTAGALKLWYRGGLGSIGFSCLQRMDKGRVNTEVGT